MGCSIQAALQIIYLSLPATLRLLCKLSMGSNRMIAIMKLKCTSLALVYSTANGGQNLHFLSASAWPAGNHAVSLITGVHDKHRPAQLQILLIGTRFLPTITFLSLSCKL